MERSFKKIATVMIAGVMCLEAASCSGLVNAPVTDITTEDTTSSTAAEPQPSASDTEDEFWAFHQQSSESSKDTEASDGKKYTMPKSSYPSLQAEMEDFYREVINLSRDGLTTETTQSFFLISAEDDVNDPLDHNKVPIKDGAVRFNVMTRLAEADPDKETDYDVTMLLQVNGEICDFEVGGKKSDNGVLKVPLHTNTDYVELFEAKDIPIRKGRNVLTLYLFYYSPALDRYLVGQSMPCNIESDKAYEGKTVKSTPEDKTGKVVTITDKDGVPDEQIYYSRIVTDKDFISYDVDEDMNDIFTLKPKPDLHYFMINDNDDRGPCDRSGIMIMFDNGELKPVWGGKTFGRLSLKKTDLRKELIIGTDFKEGESHHLNWGYLEAFNEFDDGYPHTEMEVIKIPG